MGGCDRQWKLAVNVFIKMVVLMSFMACQKHEEQPSDDVPIPVVDNHFKYSVNVAAPHRVALDEAVSLLHFLPLASDDSRLMEILKVSDLSPSTLQGWLEQRVSYIVDGEFDLTSAVYELTDTSFSYPYMDQFPDPNQGLSNNDKKSRVMSNLGAGIYCTHKKYSKEKGKLSQKPVSALAGLRVGGDVGDIVVRSPRIGLLQIGDGLFPSGLEFGTTQNISQDIYRVGTLFHEARHSDGHGKTLAFLHANCPDGHDYADRAACDFAANGPYTVGAQIQKKLMDKCDKCSVAGKETLRMRFLDFSSRVIKGQVKILGHSPESYKATPVDWDDAPEGSIR